jgi:hypothetical protein
MGDHGIDTDVVPRNRALPWDRHSRGIPIPGFKPAVVYSACPYFRRWRCGKGVLAKTDPSQHHIQGDYTSRCDQTLSGSIYLC